MKLKHPFNKKGQIDDFTDIITIVLGIILLVFFLEVVIVPQLDAPWKKGLVQVDRTQNVTNYLTMVRGDLDQGKALDLSKINLTMKNIRTPPPIPLK